MSPVQLKVSGLAAFDLDLEPETAIRDVKKLAKEESGIEPEHMKLIHKGRLLKDADSLGDCDGEAVQIMFTAGHLALEGGSQPTLQLPQIHALGSRLNWTAL